MREAAIETYLCDLIRDAGGDAVKWGVNGWPDRMLLVPGGRIGFLELKRPGKEPEPLQHERLARLQDLGFLADWANTLGGAKRFVERLRA